MYVALNNNKRLLNEIGHLETWFETFTACFIALCAAKTNELKLIYQALVSPSCYKRYVVTMILFNKHANKYKAIFTIPPY